VALCFKANYLAATSRQSSSDFGHKWRDIFVFPLLCSVEFLILQHQYVIRNGSYTLRVRPKLCLLCLKLSTAAMTGQWKNAGL
jgi:hypothetical protein